MTLTEDLGILFIGARDAVYALDLENISSKKAGTYANGTLTLEGEKEEGRGKVPFDPFQRSTSVMVVYMFFSEEAMEFDLPDKLRVSHVARDCKEDMGGLRTLQQKWTSYLMARLDCPMPLEPSLPAIIQDVFLLKDQDWRKSVFYAVFSPQTCFDDYATTSDLSTACAFSVADIGSEGRYLTPVKMESETRWVAHTGEQPVPRPGACMNNAARDLGVGHSLDLPDKTLQFVRDRPLMEGAVPPLTGGPLVLQRGAKFSGIVVDRVMAMNGEIYHVMFIGTEEDKVQKVVQYAGGDTISQTPEPIKVMGLSSGTGQLYAGSESCLVQFPVSDCGRYGSCLDCILARDPYGSWETTSAACSSVLNLPTGSRNMHQSLLHVDSSMYPRSVTVQPVPFPFIVGSPIHLPCQPASNLAQVSWHFARQPLQLRDRYRMMSQDLLIVSAVASDADRYTCQSLEEVKGRLYTRTEAVYILQPTKTLLVLQSSVAVLSVLLGAVVLWSVRKSVRKSIEAKEEHQTERVSVALLSMILRSLMRRNISRDQLSHRVFRMEEGLQEHMSPSNSSSDAVIHMGDI
ncbi:semaphorin-4E-like [Coregonus clupeaformis]|uniref:semaphorin-4E-like n=1 Tax=Coregonus clupeaformis TaxID=59861 RepID=UPI001E1C4865|nr:semaphorin-4E-like [Coregonus clupeaformis]